MTPLLVALCLVASVRAENPASSDVPQPPEAEDVTPPAVHCPSDMVSEGRFCIDRYEAPNVVGLKPMLMQTALDGEAYCAKRRKHLCTEAEWVRACEGASRRPYPYGKNYERGRCNDDKVWRFVDWDKLALWPRKEAKDHAAALDQSQGAGRDNNPALGDCATPEGVYDLIGNAAEWVRRSFPNPTNYSHVLKGCYWAGCYGGAAPSCSFVNPAHPASFRSYEAGFRCCETPAP
jgi:formylglycine-generating enzyme